MSFESPSNPFITIHSTYSNSPEIFPSRPFHILWCSYRVSSSSQFLRPTKLNRNHTRNRRSFHTPQSQIWLLPSTPPAYTSKRTVIALWRLDQLYSAELPGMMEIICVCFYGISKHRWLLTLKVQDWHYVSVQRLYSMWEALSSVTNTTKEKWPVWNTVSSAQELNFLTFIHI